MKKKQYDTLQDVESELEALREQMLSLAGIVESVFAESVIALIEGDDEAADEARVDDYRAHRVWLGVDSLAVDLLAAGRLQLGEVNLVCAISHIALNLKRMADKGMKIASLMEECPDASLPPGTWRETLSLMTDISQTMFSNSVEAFINRDPSEAGGLHPLYREVRRLAAELRADINKGLKPGGNLPPEAGTALLIIGGCIEDIAGFALDSGSCTARLYQDNSHQNSCDIDGDRE